MPAWETNLSRQSGFLQRTSEFDGKGTMVAKETMMTKETMMGDGEGNRFTNKFCSNSAADLEAVTDSK